MPDSKPTNEIRVLVTGFGPFLDITANPSWEIARNLPPTIHSPNGNPVKLIVPDSAVPAAYHKILTQTTSLIEQHDPHIVVHMGLAVDRDYFAVEKSALKEGYHDIPDVDRKVFTRAENKKTFGKALATLTTSFNLETVVEVWQDACSRLNMPAKGTERVKGKAKGKLGKKVDVRLSDDVGTYVCGFMYYVSMLEIQKKTRKRDVVFFHVPMLEGSEEISVGVEVAKELMSALVGAWEEL